MIYQSVGNRCAIDFAEFNLNISDGECINILSKLGFVKTEVDLISLARKYLGVSEYRLSSKISEAPQAFNCSGLVKWLYSLKGIWLPRRAVQQSECGTEIARNDLRAGDLVFRTSFRSYYRTNPAESVGHVGLATNDGTVIRAVSKKVGIVESDFDDFVDKYQVRKIKRIIPSDAKVHTFIIPQDTEVESSDDIFWILLQSLRK
jgi:hypothetical protein